MKYLYVWQDWGLFRVDEVEVLETGIRNERCPGVTFARVLSPRINDGKRPALVNQDHIFDSYQLAKAFGLKNTPNGAS